MANMKKGKVTGTKRGKGASNRGGEGSNAFSRSSEAGADMEDLLMDTQDGRSDEERLIEEEAERMMDRWRKMRSKETGQAGSKDGQEVRDRTARDRKVDSGDRDRRTDSGGERRVLFKDRSRLRSPPVRSSPCLHGKHGVATRECPAAFQLHQITLNTPSPGRRRAK